MRGQRLQEVLHSSLSQVAVLELRRVQQVVALIKTLAAEVGLKVALLKVVFIFLLVEQLDKFDVPVGTLALDACIFLFF